MNDYLIDTHILIWAALVPSRISKRAMKVLENIDNNIYVNAISFWEISIKYSKGNLLLGDYKPDDFPDFSEQMGFEIIQLDASTTASFYKLKAEHHKDPFDRLLIWQAIKNDYTLVTDDIHVKKYEDMGLKSLW
jgi:PIN domain nuclease of toxin-antitoxin system